MGGGIVVVVVVFISDFSFDFCLYDFAIMYSAIYSWFCFIYFIDQKKLCCSLKHNANNIFKQIANWNMKYVHVEDLIAQKFASCNKKEADKRIQ